jgi:hypothetical protein
MKHIPGTNDIVFATTQKNISVAVYSYEGHMLFQAAVPASSQNDIVTITNTLGQTELVDVLTPLTTFTLPVSNHCYLYIFYENGKRRVASGKLLLAR